MTSTQTDYTHLDDPALFAERRRVRETLEHLPEGHTDRQALNQAYEALTSEFDRRARAAWQQPQRQET